MSLTVHLLREPNAGVLAHLRTRLRPDVTLTVGPESAGAFHCDILVAGRPSREHITANSDLQKLIVPFAGLPQETRDVMLDFPDVAVHNLHHNAVAAAEMAITLMLAASKLILPSDRALREDDWTPRYRPNTVIVLRGKTVLILGYGAVGQRVAEGCRGLGMEVMATRRSPSVRPPENVYPPDAMEELLPQADVLIIALPLTTETEGLVGREELSLLPPRSVLVNVGRGPIVDEAALYRALRDGRLHAAGLDVWYNYPQDEASRSSTPPATYAFHELDNVVMSPHRAGAGGTQEIEMRRMESLAKLLNAAAAGEEIPNRVDVQAGY